jgi:hypothetical protein
MRNFFRNLSGSWRTGLAEAWQELRTKCIFLAAVLLLLSIPSFNYVSESHSTRSIGEKEYLVNLWYAEQVRPLEGKRERTYSMYEKKFPAVSAYLAIVRLVAERIELTGHEKKFFLKYKADYAQLLRFQAIILGFGKGSVKILIIPDAEVRSLQVSPFTYWTFTKNDLRRKLTREEFRKILNGEPINRV